MPIPKSQESSSQKIVGSSPDALGKLQLLFMQLLVSQLIQSCASSQSLDHCYHQKRADIKHYAMVKMVAAGREGSNPLPLIF